MSAPTNMDINLIIKQLSSLVWGPVLIFILLSTGIYFTIRLRVIQVREFFHSFKIMSGFFGMALKYASCLLLLRFRVFDENGVVAGGVIVF